MEVICKLLHYKKMNTNIMLVFFTYIILVNIVGFCMMFADKRRAVNNKWRISEKRLFTIAIIGGSVGSMCGMYIFRHKTKHNSFVVGMPIILAIQVVIGLIIFCKLFG